MSKSTLKTDHFVVVQWLKQQQIDSNMMRAIATHDNVHSFYVLDQYPVLLPAL